MKNFRSFLSMVIVLAMIGSSLYAGVLVVQKHQSADQQKSSNVKIYLEEDKMRMDMDSPDERQAFIFRDDKNLFWIVNFKENSYMEMTEKDLQQMAAMRDNAMKKMEERMKNMPPEQRKMLEQMQEKMKDMPPAQREMMKKAMPNMGMEGMEMSRPTFKMVASGVEVNQWTCDKYEGYQNEQKVKEVWTTDFDELGITREDVKIFEKFGEFVESLTRGMDEQIGASFKIGSKESEEQLGYKGIPVKTINYTNGQIERVEETEKVEKQSLDAAVFNLPSGLKQKENPMKQMKGKMEY